MRSRISAQWDLPELLERDGGDQPISCPLFRDGVPVVPTAGTVVLRDGEGTEIATSSPTGAVTITSGVATATVEAATLAAQEYGDGWTHVWTLAVGGVSRTFRGAAHCIRQRLYPCIADLDIRRRLRSADPALGQLLSVEATFQGAIDEADVAVQRGLLQAGRKPWLVTDPTVLREAWLTQAIANILEDPGMFTGNEALAEAAASWQRKADAALDKASIAFDFDEDGIPDSTTVTTASRGALWSL